MATTSLGIHYFIKDGHRDSVLSKLKGVIELCTKEPEFINAIISETSEMPNQLSCMNYGAVRGPLLMLSKESNLIERHI